MPARTTIGQTVRVMPIASRRTFLGAALVAVAGAVGVAAEFVLHPGARRPRRITPGQTSAGRSTATVAPPAPVLELALDRENALLADLAHAATTTPTLTAKIAVLRRDHRAHAVALGALIAAAGGAPHPGPTGPSAAGPSAAGPSASGPSAAGPSASGSPVGTRVTVADLARWEKAAGAAFAADFTGATGTAAAVLASICACERTHAAWLS